MDYVPAMYATFWALVPPVVAIVLALITKEVYSSLLVGVFSGLIIYEFCLEGVGFDQLITAFTLIPQVMAEQISSNAALILFLALLGALVVIIAIAGGSRAYAEWAAKHIKSARMATVMTALLGIVVFVDDYFNCLTVGAVMRPVTDKFRISHEKLAWIIDSTAAPVCIIAPVSSWAVAMGGYMGENGFNTFVASIPYNLYALVTIVFVFAMCGFGKDFFSMGKAQRDCDAHTYSPIPPHASALETVSKAGVPSNPEAVETVITEQSDLEGATKAVEQFKGLDVSPNGRVFDLVIPIVVLIVFSITGMLYVGGFFEGVDFATAVGENPIGGLCIGAAVALVVAACMFLPRKLTTLVGFTEGASEGVRSMVGAIMILVLAWSLGGACRYMLGTGEFVSNFLTTMGFELSFLPAVIFVVSGFIGFAMGTSWGTPGVLSRFWSPSSAMRSRRVRCWSSPSPPACPARSAATTARPFPTPPSFLLLVRNVTTCATWQPSFPTLPWLPSSACLDIWLPALPVRLGLRLSAVSLLPSLSLLQRACSATRKLHRRIASKRTTRESFGTPFLLPGQLQGPNMRILTLRRQTLRPNKTCRHITSLF